jgi:uncharacterized protein YkwD
VKRLAVLIESIRTTGDWLSRGALTKMNVHPTATPAQAASAEDEIAAAAATTAAVGEGVGVAAMNSIYGDILNRHNQYRTKHQAGPLRWNDQVAAAADAYASRCSFGHDANRGNVGENIYATSATGNMAGALTEAITGW